MADGSERKFAVTESKFLPTVPKSAILQFCPSRETCWGVPSPKPCSCAPYGRERRSHHAKEIQHTPHRSRVVKTRLSEEEYADFTARLAPYGISQSEFLRQAIRRATYTPSVIHVSAVNDELLSALLESWPAEYGKIGGQPQPDCPVSERVRRTL